MRFYHSDHSKEFVSSRTTFRAIIIPAGILAALILFIWAAVRWHLDLRVSGLFFDPDQQWYLKYDQPWWFLYRFGTVPGLVLGLAALGGAYLSFVKARFRPYRRQMMVVFFTAVIGGGLIVNAVLKPYWGRPRPRDVAVFGGDLAFHHPHQRGVPGQGESFPCGHCTMGYLFVTLLVFRKQSKWVAYGGAGFGFVYGTLLGMARIVQGAHFLTDVAASLGVIALTALLLNGLASSRLEKWMRMDGDLPRRRKQRLTAAVILLAVVMTLLFMTRRPFFETYSQSFSVLNGFDAIVVRSPVPFNHKRVHYAATESGRLLIRTQGFGWIQAKHRIKMAMEPRGAVLFITLHARTSGYFSELDHEIELELPESEKGRMDFRVEEMP